MKEQHAQAVIRRALKEDKIQLYKYYCQLCFGWHVTKQSQEPINIPNAKVLSK